MRCGSCKKSISKFLVLANHKIVCPECLKEIINEKLDLEITKDNQEIFDLSEACFLNGLKANDRAKMLEGIELCKVAADMNHPRAYLRLGNYYANYDFIDTSLDKKSRIIIAYEYLMNLCRSIITVREGKIDTTSVKVSAATQLLNLVYNNPDIETFNPNYSYANTKEALKDCRINGYIEPKNDYTSKTDQTLKLNNVIDSLCNGRLSNVIYMYASNVTGKEVIDIFTKDNYYYLDNLNKRKVFVIVYDEALNDQFNFEKGHNQASEDKICEINNNTKYEVFIYCSRTLMLNKKGKLNKKFTKTALNIYKSIDLRNIDTNTDGQCILYTADDMEYVLKNKQVNMPLVRAFEKYANRDN